MFGCITIFKVFCGTMQSSGGLCKKDKWSTTSTYKEEWICEVWSEVLQQQTQQETKSTNSAETYALSSKQLQLRREEYVIVFRASIACYWRNEACEKVKRLDFRQISITNSLTNYHSLWCKALYVTWVDNTLVKCV